MLRSSRTVHHHQLRDRVMKMKIERWTKRSSRGWRILLPARRIRQVELQVQGRMMSSWRGGGVGVGVTMGRDGDQRTVWKRIRI